MCPFVSAEWVQLKLDDPGFLVLDPRSAIRFLSGHLKGAVNLPLAQAFGSQGVLRPAEELAGWLGAAGLDERRIPIIYDGADGRNAAMLAWILQYLGRADAHLMEIFQERWIAEGRDIFYKPVPPVARAFQAHVNPSVRANMSELTRAPCARLVDFRSREEFSGKLDTEGRPGHIPGALNLVWQELLGADQQLLAPKEKLERLVTAAGIAPGDRVVAYCRTGVRAAVGYLALAQIGYDVRLYDGSYSEWARSGQAVEMAGPAG